MCLTIDGMFCELRERTDEDVFISSIIEEIIKIINN